MNEKLNQVSINGRMAYLIMCVEAYLVAKYPYRDWSLVAQRLWRATDMNWADWSEMYSSLIPDVLFQYTEYDPESFVDSISEEEYKQLKVLYSGITDGLEDDSSDELNRMLNLPFDMSMVYEGTVIGDGTESIAIIKEAVSILNTNGIQPPDLDKVTFSSASERNGWGNDFDGSFLSIIL